MDMNSLKIVDGLSHYMCLSVRLRWKGKCLNKDNRILDYAWVGIIY